jgi:hypothetical protein
LVKDSKTSKLEPMKPLLPLLLLLISSVSLAESGAYDVEVIIFRNLDSLVEPATVDKLRSFSQYPDLVDTRPLAANPETTSSNNQAAVLADDLPDELVEILRSDLPDEVQVITSRGTYMDDVWRRLRSSKGYRPLHYAAWQQNRVDYYPPLRIHNQDIIDSQLRPPTNRMVADLTAIDPLAAYRSHFYQLDGSVQLRRSRFLHLYLDLEYREKPAPVIPESSFFSPGELQADADSLKKETSDYAVHSLKQNRQVRTGQLQYFDTPYFGVLVFVSAISN